MRLAIISMILLLATTLQSKTSYSCYDTDTSGLNIESNYKSSKIIFAVRDKFKNFKQSFFVLLDKRYERIEGMAYLFCEKDKSGYSCSAECDGGSLKFTKGLDISAISVEFEKFYSRSDEESGEQKYIRITKKASGSKVLVESIKCPKIVKALYYPERDGRDGKYIEEKRYVCYNEKNRKGSRYSYYGCRLNNELCMYSNMAYFGHYGTLADAKDALNRCKRSAPKE